jgi:undecaprenyl diphosphate synthase
MNNIVNYGPHFATEMHSRGVRLVHAGSRTGLPNAVLGVIDDAISLTSNNDTALLALAFNYGGRLDIVTAFKTASSKDPLCRTIDEKMIEENLMTNPLPPVDLLIRTGKQVRLSNFMLWQSGNAILSFPDCYWPDFTENQLDEALNNWRTHESSS